MILLFPSKETTTIEISQVPCLERGMSGINTKPPQTTQTQLKSSRHSDDRTFGFEFLKAFIIESRKTGRMNSKWNLCGKPAELKIREARPPYKSLTAANSIITSSALL